MQVSEHGIVYANSVNDSSLVLSNSPGSLITILDGVLLPNGWSKPFSGTNKAVYRSDDAAGTRFYLWIDDTYGSYARIRGYVSMSSVDTGTGLFPTDAQINGGAYVYKASGTPRAWTLFSDGRIIYFFCDSLNSNSWYGGFCFGDIDSYVAGDAFGCLLVASSGAASAFTFNMFNNGATSYLARNYTQLGDAISSARYSHGKTSGLGISGQTYPAVTDNALHLWPVECWDTTVNARGMMPGLWNPIHNSDVPHGLMVDNIPNLPGRTLIVQIVGSVSYRCVIDITGPWR